MKVAVLSSTVFACPPKGYAGLEMVAWQRAEGLARLGHDVTLFAPDGSRCDHAKVFHFGPPGQIDERTAYDRYWQQLTKQDVVIDDTWQKWSVILKTEGVLKAPVLCVMHAPVHTMIGSLPDGVDKPCFVCISQDQADHFEALFDRPARSAYNGIDLDFYKDVRLPRSDRFLFLARFSTVKSPHLAIQGCLAAGVGLDLVGDTTITGEPDYLRKCLEMASQRSPSYQRSDEQLTVHGGVSRGETVNWYSRSLAMIHPNESFREPFGLAPLEAMACGTPVIAWRKGAMKETVKDGETGILVDSFPSLCKAIDHYKNSPPTPARRDRCRQWVGDNFSLERMVRRYDELITEAVEGGW